jgi:hypothetical protein
VIRHALTVAFACLIAGFCSCSADKATGSADASADRIAADAAFSDLCAGMCAATLDIECPNQPTMSACVEECIGQMLPCHAEVAVYFACIANNGPASVECDEVRQTVMVRDDYCRAEVDSLVACLDSATLAAPAQARLLRPLSRAIHRRAFMSAPAAGS